MEHVADFCCTLLPPCLPLAAPPPLHPVPSELEARKAGVPGRFILDDPAKYPAKDDIGFLCE